ncbi:hypothetical protein [Aquimarina rhabdastrellae]
MNKIKTFFKSQRNYKIYISLIIVYLFVILVFKIRTVNKLKNEGVFTIAKILEINPGSYAGRHIKYEFLHEDKVMYGYHSFQAWEEAPLVGEYYLNVYLKNENHLNYLFMEVKIPNEVGLSTDPKKYIPENLFIKFWKL